jgi:hypothetical protein
MSIYITPINNYGFRIITGTTTAFAYVGLKNPSSGEYVTGTYADSSGNYSFTTSSVLPLQIVVAAERNFAVLETLDVNEPPKPYADYVGDDSQNPDTVVLAVSDFPQPSGSGAWYYSGTPSVSIVDEVWDSPNWVKAGDGYGAKVSVEMANVGYPYAHYGSRFILSGMYGGIGKPMRRYTLSKLGRGYTSPKMKITGTVVFSYNGSIEQLEEATGITTGFTYNGSTYYTEPKTYRLSAYGRQLSVVGVTGVEQVWGTDHSLWGAYQVDYRDGRCTADFPSEQNITASTSIAGAQTLTDIKAVFDNANYNNGAKVNAYYAIIYGQDKDNISNTGSPGDPLNSLPAVIKDDSAIDCQRRGIITLQELDILKGYFGTKFLIGGSIPYINQIYNEYTVSFVLLVAWNTVQGLFQTSLAQEAQSVMRQYQGLIITDMRQRVKPIIDKMEKATGNSYISNLKVIDNDAKIVQFNFDGAIPSNNFF